METFPRWWNLKYIYIKQLEYRCLSVRTHWTDKICAALPKISTKFVSAKFSICQAWAHWDTQKYLLTTSVNHTEITPSLARCSQERLHKISGVRFDRICEIDPTSHWTSEQWKTAGTSVIDRLLLESGLRYKIRNMCADLCRSKGKAIMGVWINFEVTISSKESDKWFYYQLGAKLNVLKWYCDENSIFPS